MFDLDGTLVDSDAFDGALFAEAVREVVGEVAIDQTWQSYRHVTDAGVLGQIVEELGVPEIGRVVSDVRQLFGVKVERYLANGGVCRAVPGAAAAVEQLQAAGCKIGIATGGWAHTALMKLGSAGFATDDIVLASSDDGFERVAIMRACLDRLAGSAEHATYVGDGLWDLAASRDAGLSFIGVGAKLVGRCEHWIADFNDENWRRIATLLLQRRGGLR